MAISVFACCRMIMRKLLLRKAATLAAVSLFLVAIFVLHLSLQQVTEQEPWRPVTPVAATVRALSTAASSSSRSTIRAANTSTHATTIMSRTHKPRPLQCMEDYAGTADIQMSNVLDELPFDDIDGGVWKQGYSITPDASRYSSSEPLTVFVMPHSHCDPGWLRTVEDYYNRQTRNILTYMTTALLQDKKRRFIWAEISFLSMWWAEQSNQRKEDFKMLVQEGRLEIVTGGWVMNDEANTHYYAMIDQLIEGNLWVQRELGFTPKSGWAIDPFGYSPTMAYLLKRAGFSNMFIQRLHYSVKKRFSQKRWLEFGWRQQWDKDGSTDMFCHATPFYSYDIPHTCGPDPKICCQFDFIRAAGSKYNCPWKINPQPITNSNARDRVSMLVDQYRKKAHLYRTRYLIAPLGDDFRYDTEKEVRLQFTNYEMIIDYVDAHPELNIKIKFGTLSDYFDAIRADSAQSDPAPNPAVPSGFPTLSGDFYTYSDKAKEYWSGYYTSRPFTKHMSRVLESTLRSAEILLSLSIAHHRYLPHHATLLGDMVRARRELALFQHHDGITGTAKEAVVRDYISRLVKGVATGQRVIAAATQTLLLGQRAGETDDIIVQVDRHYPNTDSVLVHRKVSLVGGASVGVTLVNPVGYQRTVLVKLRVDTPDVKVIDAGSEADINSQLSPVWAGPCEIAADEFELIFPATLSPLGIHGYQLLYSTSDHAVRASVFTINCHNTITSSVFNVQSRTSGGGPIELQSSSITASFSSSTGLLQSLQPTNQPSINMVMDIVQYGALTGAARSGAYLFLPDRDASSIITRQTGRVGVVSGHLVQGVRAVYDVVTTTVELHSEAVSSNGVSIVNTVDIRALYNKEVAMRLQSGVANSNGVFFTDLNGYQMQRRRTMGKLPTQGNYYPMPTVVMMEDDTYRLSLLSDHSAGVASLRQGWLEAMMDRRLMQDDYRGLGQPLKDNKMIELSYHLLLEPRPQTHPPSGAVQAFQSLLAHTLSDLLIHPPISLLPTGTSSLLSHFSPSLSLLTHPLPCGVHLLNLRSLEDRESGLILHHRGVACSYQTTPSFTCSLPDDNMLALSDMFSDVKISSADEVSLSLLHKLRPLSQSTSYSTHLNPMEIQSYRIKWS